jgi:transposase
VIAPKLPYDRRLGRSREVDLREVINAFFYILRAGCPWRMLPQDVPPRLTVQRYFYAWRDQSVWQGINHNLFMAAREDDNREARLSAGVIDSQSVKTTDSSGPRVTMPARRSRAGGCGVPLYDGEASNGKFMLDFPGEAFAPGGVPLYEIATPGSGTPIHANTKNKVDNVTEDVALVGGLDTRSNVRSWPRLTPSSDEHSATMSRPRQSSVGGRFCWIECIFDRFGS